MALVSASRRVEHDDALVLVAVGDVDLVGSAVDFYRRGPTEGGRVIAPETLPCLADLQQELPVARELQHVVVVVAVAADPHIALGIDMNAVFELKPVVAGTGPAPRLNDVAVAVELDDRRSGNTAHRGRRLLRCGGFLGRQ
jgi:hypothetical protein